MTVLPITEADVRGALDVLARSWTGGLKPRDAIHAATMQSHGLSQIISADRDFDRRSFVTRIDPLAYRL
jgi:predicted nucleic acid-binding protein